MAYVTFALNVLWTVLGLLGMGHVIFRVRKMKSNTLDTKDATESPAPVSSSTKHSPNKKVDADDLKKVTSDANTQFTLTDSLSVQLECGLTSLNDSTKQILTKLDSLAEKLDKDAIQNSLLNDLRRLMLSNDFKQFLAKKKNVAKVPPKLHEQPSHTEQVRKSTPRKVDSFTNYSQKVNPKCLDQDKNSERPYDNMSPYALETDEPPLRFTTGLQDSTMASEKVLARLLSMASEFGMSDSVARKQEDILRSRGEQVNSSQNVQISPDKSKVQFSPPVSRQYVSYSPDKSKVQFSPDKSGVSDRRNVRFTPTESRQYVPHSPYKSNVRPFPKYYNRQVPSSPHER